MIFAICTGFTFPPFNVIKRSGLPFHVVWNSNCLQLGVNGPLCICTNEECQVFILGAYDCT